VINVKNTDNQCFKWCVARALNPVQKHAERVDKLLRVQAKQLYWNGLEFHVTLDDIDKFEKLSSNLAINVFNVNSKYIEPLRISKAHSREAPSAGRARQGEVPVSQYINLLLYEEHYCLI
jgi:hypothetical protein